MAILRLSLAAYKLARTVGIDGVYSRLINATRGITAGSGFATAELKVLLLDLMQELHCRWAAVLTIKLFVDDITLASCGKPREVVALVTRVLGFVVHHLENVLLMEVSAKKSKVVAGRPALAQAIAAGVASGKVSQARHAKLLGTDTVGGRRRTTQVAQRRLSEFSQVVPRFQAMRRLGANAKLMVRAVGPPAILYGCEVMGICDTSLHNMRTKVAAAAAPQAGGKKRRLGIVWFGWPLWYLGPCLRSTLQPAQTLGACMVGEVVPRRHVTTSLP